MAETERFDSNGNKVNDAAKKKGGKLWIFATIIIVIYIAINSCLVVCHEDEYKLVRQFGRVDRTITNAGLFVKIPIIESVDTVPKKVLLYDLPVSDVITSDKKTMIVDCYVLWRVTDPLKFAQTLSHSVGNAENRIDQLVYNAMKNTISNMTQDEVIRSRDGKITVTDTEITSDVENNDIVVKNVKIKDEIVECKIREVLKKQKQKVFVGDYVEFSDGAIETVGGVVGAFESAFKGAYDKVKEWVDLIIEKVKEAGKAIAGLNPFASGNLPDVSVTIGADGEIVTEHATNYDTPALLKKPTMFATNHLGGDRGSYNGGEVVYGHDPLMNDIRQASAEGSAMLVNAVVDSMNKVYKILADYLPDMASKQPIIDINSLAPAIDTQLGVIAIRKGRGN